jgi:hypothetical protein
VVYRILTVQSGRRPRSHLGGSVRRQRRDHCDLKDDIRYMVDSDALLLLHTVGVRVRESEPGAVRQDFSWTGPLLPLSRTRLTAHPSRNPGDLVAGILLREPIMTGWHGCDPAAQLLIPQQRSTSQPSLTGSPICALPDVPRSTPDRPVRQRSAARFRTGGHRHDREHESSLGAG